MNWSEKKPTNSKVQHPAQRNQKKKTNIHFIVVVVEPRPKGMPRHPCQTTVTYDRNAIGIRLAQERPSHPCRKTEARHRGQVRTLPFPATLFNTRLAAMETHKVFPLAKVKVERTAHVPEHAKNWKNQHARRSRKNTQATSGRVVIRHWIETIVCKQ